MALEQEDFKSSGTLLSKEDDGRGFPWDGSHGPYLTQDDLPDQTHLKSMENHGSFWIRPLTEDRSLDYDVQKEKGM
jgi:hypothetical protein